MKQHNFSEISSEELKKGSVFALVNAYQIFGDAMILKGLNRFQRVFALIKLSLEEVSKSLVLLELSIQKQFAEVSPEYQSKYVEKAKNVKSIFFSHNSKTKYIIEYAVGQSEQFIKYHLNKFPADHHLPKELQNLKEMMNDIKSLDNKKNSSFYISLIDNKFTPPDLEITDDDIQELENFTFPILIKAKRYLDKKDDKYFDSIGIKPAEFREMDPHEQSRRIHKLVAYEWNEK